MCNADIAVLGASPTLNVIREARRKFTYLHRYIYIYIYLVEAGAIEVAVIDHSEPAQLHIP